MKKVMSEGVKILDGPFDTREEAWVAEEKINPEGWSGLYTPKVARGFDDKWYVILPLRVHGCLECGEAFYHDDENTNQYNEPKCPKCSAVNAVVI